MSLRPKWVLVALLACVAGQPGRSSGEPPTVRIGLLVGVQSVAFSGVGGVTVQDLAGEVVVAWAPSGETWTISLRGVDWLLTDQAGGDRGTGRRGALLLPPEGGAVTVCGVAGHWDGVVDREYRGLIEVRERAGSLTVVNVVDVETYLRGVVPSEMPAGYPGEALRAQAVAARGQALLKAGRHRAQGFDLCAAEHCQVYGGATSQDPRTDQAVLSTRGEVLEYEGRLADTLYSSNCGGHTVNSEDYWVNQPPTPYLRAAPDFDRAQVPLEFPLPLESLHQYLKYAPAVHCNQPRYARASRFRWWSVVSASELQQTLRASLGDFGDLLNVRVVDRADSGVVREIAVVGTRSLPRVRGGPDIRRALGGLNSASFAIEPIREGDDAPIAYTIWGAGWGHQVGLCQVGAAGLADLGWDSRRILAKYYPACATVRRY